MHLHWYDGSFTQDIKSDWVYLFTGTVNFEDTKPASFHMKTAVHIPDVDILPQAYIQMSGLVTMVLNVEPVEIGKEGRLCRFDGLVATYSYEAKKLVQYRMSSIFDNQRGPVVPVMRYISGDVGARQNKLLELTFFFHPEDDVDESEQGRSLHRLMWMLTPSSNA